MYQPLPDELYIRKSAIEGMGVFAKEDIDGNVILGLSHIVVDGELIRTPLGGFVNHSDTPNTIKIQKDNRYYLYTIREIKKGEELTLKYTFYSVKNELGTK